MSGAEGGGEIVLALRGITKRFGPTLANDRIDLTLRRGEAVALLGENGAGKTTLMNILFGQYAADEGTVEVFGRPLAPGRPRAALEAGVGMVHQHFTLAENLTVLENILLGAAPLTGLSLGRGAARARLAALSAEYGLKVEPDARVGALTVGERQRVEILKALWRDARILILDEPTAVLTPQEAEALFATLRRAAAKGLSLVFISHKLHEVMAVANRVVVLRRGRVAGAARVAETDARRLAAMMVGAEVERPVPAPSAPGAPLLALDSVSTRPSGARPGLRRVSLQLRAGTITGLAGVSGNGQAALAALVAGAARPAEGRILLEGGREAGPGWSPRAALRAGVGRVPEDRKREGVVADFTLAENAVLEAYRAAPFSRLGWLNRRAARAQAAALIAEHDIRCPGPEARIRLLSGGNMQKLILGRALAPSPRVILADQPARGLDVGAVAAIHAKLLAARDGGAAVLLISEDLDEVMTLSDVIHVISEGRLSPPFARGEMSAAALGLRMAGEGFADAA
ncbi:MAG: ABC transporter ATP-binding protein [Pikeienuella sp.]|uniref:ABC transporter ATP-binding protein n=1 Tax=Pikeienuella sp. TaxID=2831957 RepID=UPI00391D0C5D